MRIPTWLLPATVFGSAIFMLGLISAGYLLVSTSQSLPDVESIKGVELKVPLRVYSADGLLISEFGDERRKPLDLDQVPNTLIKAVLASEDDRFFEHQGVDATGLVRAALSNFRSGETQQGASTITMQVARNFFLTREKTYIRKLREVLLAFKLEQILSKGEILHLYLNKIFLGHRAYGFGAAADVYYGRPLNDLTLAELAMLAGLPKAPSSNNPLRNPARAITRRNYVLNRMLTLGHIDQVAYEAATGAPVTASKHARTTELDAPHIAEMVRAQLLEEYGEEAYWAGLTVYTTIQAVPQTKASSALRAGLQAYDKRHGFRGPVAEYDLDTALSEDQERAATLETVLAKYPNSREQRPALVLTVNDASARVHNLDLGELTLTLEDSKWARPYRTPDIIGDRPNKMSEVIQPGDLIYIEPIPQSAEQAAEPEAIALNWRLSQIPTVAGALIAIDPSTGQILSLVGGYDFFLNKYNRAVQSIRQPGSNIKPFIYSGALDKGFTPASLISGAPIVMTDPVHGTVWRPENYSGKFYGPTRIRDALAKSMNLVSIRLLRSIGIPYTRDYLERFGIDMNRFSSSLTMALGSGGITPLELLSAYGVIANGGYRVEPYFIERIEDRHGEVIFTAEQPEFCDECYAQYLPQPPEDQRLPTAPESSPQNDSFELLDQPLEEGFEEDLGAPKTYTAPRVMNRANNFLTKSMMRDVIQRGTARKVQSLNRLDLAGKTGTTNDYVDAWFTGFNDQIATTVWIGFDDPATMGRGEAGSRAALPIWIDYMGTVLKNVKQTKQITPSYMQAGWVNRVTGKRTEESDPAAVPEFFPIPELLPEPFGEIGLAPTIGLEIDALDEEVLDARQDLIEQDLEPELPAERILEQEEETEGLF